MRMKPIPKGVPVVEESPVDKVLAELTFEGQALPYKAMRGEKVKLSLGSSIPLWVAEALYVAGAQGYKAVLEQKVLEADMEQKAKVYDYQSKVDYWLTTITAGMVLMLMVLLKLEGIL